METSGVRGDKQPTVFTLVLILTDLLTEDSESEKGLEFNI